ncbi:uncharacterized protein ISCGN_012560 [Ixodes scapularis]
MIGARGDKCIRIKTHPSHSIIDSVHEWERDGLFPVLRKDRRAQDDVPVSPSRSSGGAGEGDGTKTSPCAQGSNRSRHQPVLPPLPIMAPRRSKGTSAEHGSDTRVLRQCSAGIRVPVHWPHEFLPNADTCARVQSPRWPLEWYYVFKRSRRNNRNDLFFPAMIPDPDYSDSEEEQDPHRRRPLRMPGMATGSIQSGENMGRVQMGEDGLIVPRKPLNPCAESAERKNLHKELLFNQKIGKNVLGQKTELQKVMEKMKDEHKRKELEEERQRGRTALEKRLEEQANKLKLHEETEMVKADLASSEESEFLRVHARVCSHTLPVDSKS